MNYSKTLVVNGTGALILEIDSNQLDSVIVSADVDIYWGFEDLSQAVFPLLANSAFTLDHTDFRNPILQRIYNTIMHYLGQATNKIVVPDQRVVRIYAKRQVAGNANIYISYLGGNI